MRARVRKTRDYRLNTSSEAGGQTVDFSVRPTQANAASVNGVAETVDGRAGVTARIEDTATMPPTVDGISSGVDSFGLTGEFSASAIQPKSKGSSKRDSKGVETVMPETVTLDG